MEFFRIFDGRRFVSGCKVYKTAEILLAAFEDVIYARELVENDSGYEELVVHENDARNAGA